MLQLDLKKYKMDNGQDFLNEIRQIQAIVRINLMLDMDNYRRNFIQNLRQKKSIEPTEPSECSTKG